MPMTKDEYNDRHKLYYLKNKERIAARYKEKYAAGMAQKYREQRDIKLAYQKEYAIENKDAIVQYQAAYFKQKTHPAPMPRVNRASCGVHVKIIPVVDIEPIKKQLKKESLSLAPVIDIQVGQFIIYFD